MNCACGQVVQIKKTGECKKCYHQRYDARRHKALYKPRTRVESKPLSTPCTYSAAHQRVYAYRGRAIQHDCITCGKRADHWSYRGGSAHELSGEVTKHGRVMHASWSPRIEDYDPLCISCHAKRDGGWTRKLEFKL